MQKTWKSVFLYTALLEFTKMIADVEYHQGPPKIQKCPLNFLGGCAEDILMTWTFWSIFQYLATIKGLFINYLSM